MDGITTVIDADSIVWIVAYNHRDTDDVDHMMSAVDAFIESILNRTNCRQYLGFIGGERTFRHDVAKTKVYKGNRPPKPDWMLKWEFPIKAHMRNKWQFQVVNRFEADDAVATCATKIENCVVAGADKDLKQIPGNHYDFRTNKFSYVTEVEAARYFWKQMITGDTSDNIGGIKGKGPAFAAKLLDGVEDVELMERLVKIAYSVVYAEKGDEMYDENDSLLRLCTTIFAGYPIPIPYKQPTSEEEVSDETLKEIEDIWKDSSEAI